MPMHLYVCRNDHQFEKFEPITRSRAKCPTCGARAELTVATTGTPILKAGRGGFARPTRQEHEPTIGEKFQQVNDQ